jgi:hypothetical protein
VLMMRFGDFIVLKICGLNFRKHSYGYECTYVCTCAGESACRFPAMATSDLKTKISFSEFIKKGHIDIDVRSLSTHQLYVEKQDKSSKKKKKLFCYRNLCSFFNKKKRKRKRGKKKSCIFFLLYPCMFPMYWPLSRCTTVMCSDMQLNNVMRAPS